MLNSSDLFYRSLSNLFCLHWKYWLQFVLFKKTFIVIPFSTEPIAQLVLEVYLLQKKLNIHRFLWYSVCTTSILCWLHQTEFKKKISLMTFSTTFHWKSAEKSQLQCKLNLFLNSIRNQTLQFLRVNSKK